MTDFPPHSTPESQERDLAEYLAFLAAHGEELVASSDPKAALEGALSGIAGLLDLDSGDLFLAEAKQALPRGAIELSHVHDRRFAPWDVDLLRAWTSLTALAMSKASLSAVVAERDRLSHELELAAEIQRNLLPRSDPETSPVFGLNLPARRVSGDFFDFFDLDDGAIAFAVGDVSGKGMNAALLMAKTASLFRCLGKVERDPAALLAVINREICETASHGMFVTMVAGLYMPGTGRIRFANAGHEPPLLRRPDRSYRNFPASAPPLGILPDLDFEICEADLAGGEFYVFTDGLTEYRYRNGEELGVDGLIQLVEALAEQPFAERLRILLEELDQAGWEARDDLTVLAIDDAWTAPDIVGGRSDEPPHAR